MIIKIGKNKISKKHKTYFIADIGASHDQSLSRAKRLIYLCAKAGANAAKFQHFKAETIISDYGFKTLRKTSGKNPINRWKKSVYEVYQDGSINNAWTEELMKHCKKCKIDFFTAPYDLDYVDSVNQYVPAYKIGSGDITWHDIVEKIAKKRKPVIIATGASAIEDVKKAVKIILKYTKKIVLMQCNTNYEGGLTNSKFLNLRVLHTYEKIFKDKVILGLSDHTSGHNSVLAAVAMGARVVEKHFTDDNFRAGADHPFSMNPTTWKEMVDETRRLESSLGDGVKKIEPNELETVEIQRRSIRANKALSKGKTISNKDLAFLRPCPTNGLNPYEKNQIIGKKLLRSLKKGEIINCKNTG